MLSRLLRTFAENVSDECNNAMRSRKNGNTTRSLNCVYITFKSKKKKDIELYEKIKEERERAGEIWCSAASVFGE